MCPIYVPDGLPHPAHGAPRGWLVWKMCRRRSMPSGLCKQHEAEMRAGRIAPVGAWRKLEADLWLA